MLFVKRAFLLMAGALLLAAAPSVSEAGLISSPTTLDVLLTPGNFLKIGDKTFTGFSYTRTGNMPSAAGVTVTTIIDSDGNLGLRFQGAFLDRSTSVGDSIATIGYTANVVGGSFLISDLHLTGNPAVSNQGTGSITVTESTGSGTLTIFSTKPGSTVNSAQLTLANAVSSLAVTTTIDGHAITGTTSVSFVSETFSQTPIPEPASLVLWGLGGVALVACQRRSRRQA